jgi:hypothetical protein
MAGTQRFATGKDVVTSQNKAIIHGKGASTYLFFHNTQPRRLRGLYTQSSPSFLWDLLASIVDVLVVEVGIVRVVVNEPRMAMPMCVRLG